MNEALSNLAQSVVSGSTGAGEEIPTNTSTGAQNGPQSVTGAYRPITIYAANCFQNEKNSYYPNAVKVHDLESLKRATKKDNVCCRFKGAHRSIKDFISADCFPMDLDNTHSEIATNHKTLEDVKAAFPGVCFYWLYSRNHMKPKLNKQGKPQFPRYKIHLYFPLSNVCTGNYIKILDNIKTAAGCLFPYFDNAAADVPRFCFGIDHAEDFGGYVAGDACVDEYIKALSSAGDLNSRIVSALDTAEEMAIAEYGKDWDTQKNEDGSSKNNFPDLRVWKERSASITGAAPQNTDNKRYDNIGIAAGDFSGEPNLQQLEKCSYFEDFAQFHKIQFRKQIQGVFVYYFVPCPWEDTHTSGGENAKVTILPLQDGNAAIRYNCPHGHCTEKGWREYKAFYESRDGAHNQTGQQTEPGAASSGSAPEEIVTGITADTPRPHNIRDYISGKMANDIVSFGDSVKTGFSNLDAENRAGGLYPGLYVLAAVSSLGKTTFAAQLADHIAAGGNDVLFFSLEMSRLEMISKSLTREVYKKNRHTEITSLLIRRQHLTDEVLEAADSYSAAVGGKLSIIESDFNCTPAYIGKYVRDYITQNPGARPVVFIDYLQIMQADPQPFGRHLSTKEVIDTAVVELKRLTRKYGVTVIAISAVNRANYTAPIDFESLKESGAIEYTADSVWGLQLQCLHQPPFTDNKPKLTDMRAAIDRAKRENPRKIELHCLKNRYGIATYSCYFNYFPEKDYFEPADSYLEAYNN